MDCDRFVDAVCDLVVYHYPALVDEGRDAVEAGYAILVGSRVDGVTPLQRDFAGAISAALLRELAEQDLDVAERRETCRPSDDGP